MTTDLKHILEYWDREDVESMYDKHLLNAEIELIRRRLGPGLKILDAGCGEGEGTLAYASLPDAQVHAVDFSATRLRKAGTHLAGRGNVTFQQVDFLKPYQLDRDFDAIVSQRFLINLPEWPMQAKVLLEFMAHLKPGGRLLMLEGSQGGVAELNGFRTACGLEPIPVKWHNLFFDDAVLVRHMAEHGYPLVEEDGLGAYFLLTRGIRPLLDPKLDWDCPFNRTAAAGEVAANLGLGSRYSRLKLWVFRK